MVTADDKVCEFYFNNLIKFLLYFHAKAEVASSIRSSSSGSQPKEVCVRASGQRFEQLLN